jgi:hypothetical protein
MKLLNFSQFLKEDNPILFSGQGGQGNISSKENIFSPTLNLPTFKKNRGKKYKIPQGAITQPPTDNADQHVNRLLQ